jgi:hypothetical protein
MLIGFSLAFPCSVTRAQNILLPMSLTKTSLPRGDIPKLEKLLKSSCDDIGEQVIWERSNRKLIVRRCDDRYGKGVDVRYYKNSPEYKGWEQRGIRFKDEDFISLGNLLRASRLLEF